MQENNYLKFGNFTLSKLNTLPYNENKGQRKPNEFDLNCIPENSKSSEISSQHMSKKGERLEDDFLPLPVKKTKQKRVSDFKRLEEKNAMEI